MNVVINTSEKTGWVTIYMNDLFPGMTDHSEHWFPLLDCRGLDMTTEAGESFVQFHVLHEEVPFLFTYASSTVGFQVDSVNGTAPTSLQNLKELLLNLMK